MSHLIFPRDSKVGIELQGKDERYTLEKRLDQKNRVYLAKGMESGTKVVAKWYPPDGPYTTLFFREVMILDILGKGGGHSNVMTEFEYIKSQNGTYIITPHVEGNTLRNTHMALYPLDLSEIAAIMGGTFEGLDFLHRREVVHRDIKTENIYLACDEEIDGIALAEGKVTPKIFDFDCAIHPLTEDMEMEGAFVGTYEYAAPEVWLGYGAEKRSDVYSLGCLLYELLTGQTPFANAIIDAEERKNHFYHGHTRFLAPDPRKLSEGLSDRTVHTLLKALEKDPDNRYQTARHFRDAFFDAL